MTMIAAMLFACAGLGAVSTIALAWATYGPAVRALLSQRVNGGDFLD